MTFASEDMKTVYRHHATERAGYYQSILESEGIRTLLKNETTLQVEGTGFPNYIHAELCVVDDDGYVKAIEILTPLEADLRHETMPIGD